MGSISKEYMDKVKDILIGETAAEKDPAGIGSLIDQFPTSAIENLSNYWNESVNEFKTNFEKILPKVNWDKTKDNGHDAGYQFNKSPYVNPNVNEINENYDDVRDTDALQTVLKNDENLDYTIWNDKNKPIDEQIRIYITRLLMPRYKRRVEIEDLDRNFWVIGQNLTALNKIVLSIGDNLLNQLIAELCGLWDNIYRLWQLLINIEDEINKLSSGDKVRVMMEYGYGKLQSQDNNPSSSVVFTKDVMHEYGIVPYISTAYLSNSGKNRYVAYMQYNKRLIDVYDDFLSDDSSLIKIEKKTGRDISKIMKYIRSRNFTLIAQSNSNCFSNLIAAENPILKALDFYRDYLVYTEDADNGNALNIFFTDKKGKNGLGTWKQAGYFKHIDPDKNTTVAPSITNAIKNSFSILMKLILDKFGGNRKCNFLYFCQKVVTAQDITTLKNSLSEYTFDQLINDFYNLFYDCQRLVGIKEPPIFNTDNDTGYYSVPKLEESIMSTFVNALKDYNKKYATEIRGSGDSAKYYFKMWKGGYLPTVVWDLLSMGSSRSGSLMNGFGQDYFYPYSKNEDHLWIDFVSNLKTDSCYDSVDGRTIYNDTSLIGSITINDLLNSERSQEKDTLYDVNITVPINKEAASTDSSSPQYHNFVRINRPYPNIVKLTQNTMNPHGSGPWSDLKHLKELNNDANWISSIPKSNGKIYYCVDGFYTFTEDEYHAYIREDDKIGSTYTDDPTEYNLDNILIYQISTSDMISCDHPAKGISRISNLYNFEDPILNIRFINGKFKGQEIEIITSKDKADIPTTKIEIPVDSELKYVEIPFDIRLEGDNGVDSGVDCFAYKQDEKIYDTWALEDDIARSNADIFASKHGNLIYFRQGCSLNNSVDQGVKLSVTKDEEGRIIKVEKDGDPFYLLTATQAREYLKNQKLINDKRDKIQIFLVTRQILNHLRGDNNIAGLFLGYIFIYLPGKETPIRYYTINKVITPVFYHDRKQEINVDETEEDVWNRAPQVIFMRDSDKGTFGHLHSYLTKDNYNNKLVENNEWILTAYGLLKAGYNFDDPSEPSFVIDIVLPDFSYGLEMNGDSLLTRRKNTTWDQIKDNTQVYGQIKLSVKGRDVSLKFYWHGDEGFEYYRQYEGGKPVYRLSSGDLVIDKKTGEIVNKNKTIYD